jgi:hypothetical protein
MSEHDERILKEWANTYVEAYGSGLLREREAMRQQNVRYATPRADRLVRELSQGQPGQPGQQDRKKRSKAPLFVGAAAAACLVLFIGAFAVLGSISDVILPPSQTVDNTPPGATAPGENAAPGTPGATAPQDSWTELKPIGFNLPSQFTVAESKFDKGQSIYKLDNSLHDDVILTMQQPTGEDDGVAEMDSVLIDGKAVPAIVQDEYKLLRFEDEGTLYTISCKDDLGTLATLYRSIVDPENKKV